MTVSDTPIAGMVAAMLAANVPHDMIALAVATVERAAATRGQSTDMSTLSAGGQVDTRQERQRASWRRQKRNQRARRENSSPASADRPANASTIPVVDMVDMSTSPSLSVSSFKKERTSEREARAKPRPVDIPVDWQLSAEDERFAADRGWSPAEIADVAFKYKNFRARGGKRGWQEWVLDERRPLRIVQGGKADPREEMRRKFEAIVGRPLAAPTAHPTPNTKSGT
jgi:hypothetical protein